MLKRHKVTPCDIIQLVTANERNSPHPDTLGGSHKAISFPVFKKIGREYTFHQNSGNKAIFVRTLPCLPCAPYPPGRFPFPPCLMQNALSKP
jgi:hypothetical protein